MCSRNVGTHNQSHPYENIHSLRKTNLKQLKTGDKVNIERAMGAHDRNSGHFVQGHVDGTGDILVGHYVMRMKDNVIAGNEPRRRIVMGQDQG